MSDVETRIFVFPPTRPTIWGALSVLVLSVRPHAHTHTGCWRRRSVALVERTHTHATVALRFALCCFVLLCHTHTRALATRTSFLALWISVDGS